MQVPLILEQEEVQGLINVLGDLPTKSNAYPLMIKIANQANEFLNTPVTPNVPAETTDETGPEVPTVGPN